MIDLPQTIRDQPFFIQGRKATVANAVSHSALHIAIIKICYPQAVDDSTLSGVAQTLSQLRTLGLLSIIVLDCGQKSTLQSSSEQANRLAILLGAFENQNAVVLESDTLLEPACGLFPELLKTGSIPIVGDFIYSQDTGLVGKTDTERTVVTLIKLLSPSRVADGHVKLAEPSHLAIIESVIVLDPIGAIPREGEISVPHRFVNLHQEYESIIASLCIPTNIPKQGPNSGRDIFKAHRDNLSLVNEALALLPATASALIASPYLAAITARPEAVTQEAGSNHQQHAGFATVKTRPSKNPLIHNLLTDKPVYSASLPVDKLTRKGLEGRSEIRNEIATLVKRGMPVNVLRSAVTSVGEPPAPGMDRLRLTDTSVDRDKLLFLIEDSFNRKLNFDNYIKRVNDKLAALVIAGDYEGVAILTWEVPNGLSEEEAYQRGRLVPYLDKFAVLKHRQGSGGVADIVFNAMVQDCFPAGVCWRSRANNPVNKWYFERSSGTKKLGGTEWVMFWTTDQLEARSPRLDDYESVCRQIQPSWLM